RGPPAPIAEATMPRASASMAHKVASSPSSMAAARRGSPAARTPSSIRKSCASSTLRRRSSARPSIAGSATRTPRSRAIASHFDESTTVEAEELGPAHAVLLHVDDQVVDGVEQLAVDGGGALVFGREVGAHVDVRVVDDAHG